MQERRRLYSIGLLLAFTAAMAFLAQCPEDVRLTVGKSIVTDYPTDISRISMSNPDGPSTINISDALYFFAFRPDLKPAILLKALQSRKLLQIMAEPDLLTTTGKKASFVLGCEFPLSILQGGSNADAITIQSLRFGQRMNFNPFITKNNTIKLYVKPEVSTGGLSFNGLTISAVLTRKMETNIEVSAGPELCDRGLIDNRVTETISKIPGGRASAPFCLPILGNLFKSKDGDRSKTELVVLVTPEVTMPLQPGEANAGHARDFLTPLTSNGTEEPVQSRSKGNPNNKCAESDMRNIE